MNVVQRACLSTSVFFLLIISSLWISVFFQKSRSVSFENNNKDEFIRSFIQNISKNEMANNQIVEVQIGEYSIPIQHVWSPEEITVSENNVDAFQLNRVDDFPQKKTIRILYKDITILPKEGEKIVLFAGTQKKQQIISVVTQVMGLDLNGIKKQLSIDRVDEGRIDLLFINSQKNESTYTYVTSVIER